MNRIAPQKVLMPKIENFALIIGAMKCGTTSLYNYLVTHPQIARCKIKEPNFFASKLWTKGPEHYRSLWKSYDPAQHAYALEASSRYTKSPQHKAAKRIGGFDARFKFLYIVRDPVDRIESHIAHSIAKGRTTLETYPSMMEQVIDVSRYAYQLDVFREAVGGQEVLVLDFDELSADPRRLLRRCTDFLGIDNDFTFETRPPSNTRRARNGSETFKLSPAERRELRQRLAEDVARFSERYGFDVSRWEDRPEASVPAQRPVSAEPARQALQAAPEARRATPAEPAKKPGYWLRRQNMMYYTYVLWMAERLAHDARSLIDVGSHNTSIAEQFSWIPERVALDMNTPYSSEAVTGITANFFDYRPERRFDFALCLQVLEHVPDAPRFAKKLLDVADRVLVSVPYQWPKGTYPTHCQDPVDKAKLAGWFGRAPDYQIVVEEPFRERRNSRRLIAYFHTPGEPFRLATFREMKLKRPTGSKQS